LNQEIFNKLSLLLQGQVPEEIGVDDLVSDDERRLADLLNELFTNVREVHSFIVPLSQGQLNGIRLPQPRNFFSSPFKELHSRLVHLTWQANQVAQGDYNQRIDFMGDFSDAFNAMIVSLDRNEKDLKIKIAELKAALSRISQLEGILPICSRCKKIRQEGTDPREQNSWEPVESFITAKTLAMFSHGLCPECMAALYGDSEKW